MNAGLIYGTKTMKRILLLICVLLLVVDLADDGSLGKLPTCFPRSPGNSDLTISPDSSGKIAAQAWLPLGELRVTLQYFQNQPVLSEVGNTLAKIDCSLLGSSGGLPL